MPTTESEARKRFEEELKGLKLALKLVEDTQAKIEVLMPKLGIDSLLKSRKREIRHCATGVISQILYQRVECDDDPRDITDWLTGEKFYDKRISVKFKVALARRDLILRVYDFYRESRKGWPQISNDLIMNNVLRGIHEYYEIIQWLWRLSSDVRYELFKRAASSEKDMYRYIHGVVWRCVYDSIVDFSLSLRPPYGAVRH